MGVKVGVISLGENLGKSHLIATLAGVYSRSQNRNVSILSTGSAEDNMDLVDIKVKDVSVSNAYVFKSILGASDKGDLSLFNYGFKQGNEGVYIFDIMNTSFDKIDLREFFVECMDKIPANLTLVEIKGDYDTDWNREILSLCDCYIVLFDASIKGLKALTKFRETESLLTIQKSAFVLAKYDPAIISIKKIHKTTGISNKELFQWPYNVQVCKYGLEGILDRAAYGVTTGEPNLIELRERLAELMRFMFDSPTRKVIKEVNKWSK